MPLIPDDVIDAVLTRTDIAEVIGRYVALKRAGRHFKALCPFHKEKTPSFHVNADKQIFHCFGCGVGGNVFSFLMQHDRLSFPEAVRQLAEHTGISIPDAPGEDRGAHERLSALMDKVCKYFERALGSPQGRATRKYLEERGVADASREQFRLGLAPAGWDRLLTAARTAGVTAEALEAAGLLVKGQRGSSYDRFRNRLIFPITDVRGRVIAFGGRSLDGKEPKYLNSPETPLYVKGRHLFGLAQAKDAIVAAKTAVVVEGYFDCVVLSSGGIVNVVSPLGTALTSDQARLLKRYAERVILAFDADAAGEQATLRGIDLLVEAGLHVDVAPLPAGADPDEVLRAQGRERFEALLGQSTSIFEYLLAAALRRTPPKNVEQTVKVARFVLPTIARVPDAMLRSEYVRLLSERLRLDEQAIAQELAKAQPRGSETAAAPTTGGPVARPAAVPRGPEALLTAMVLEDPSRWVEASEQIAIDDITDPGLRRVLRAVAEVTAAGRGTTAAHVVSRLTEAGDERLVAALVELGRTALEPQRVFEDCVKRISKRVLEARRDAARERLKAAEQTGRATDVQRLLQEYQDLLSTAVVQPKGG